MAAAKFHPRCGGNIHYPDGTLKWIAPGCRRCNGAPLDYFIGKNWMAFLDKSDFKRAKKMNCLIVKNKQPILFINDGISMGKPVKHRFLNIPILDENRNIIEIRAYGEIF